MAPESEYAAYGVDFLAQLRATSQTFSNLARVPLAPVSNWAERAAFALAHIRGPSPVVVYLLEPVQRSKHRVHWSTVHAGAWMFAGDGVGGRCPELHDAAQHRTIAEVEVVGFPSWREELREAGPAGSGRNEVGAELYRRAQAIKTDPRVQARGAHTLEQGVRCRPELAIVVQRLRDQPWSPVDAMRLRVAALELARIADDAFKSTVRAAWLTVRETQVLDLLVTGDGEQEIADKMRRSRFTVHDHVKNIYRKLGVTTRAELVRLAVGARVLGLPEQSVGNSPGGQRD
jgi:DNA-binding CsgD family transcriptional regulator